MLNEAKPEECTGKCEEAEKAKTREDVLKDAKRDPKRPTLDDGSEQYVKPGGMPEADADFDAMNHVTYDQCRKRSELANSGMELNW